MPNEPTDLDQLEADQTLNEELTHLENQRDSQVLRAAVADPDTLNQLLTRMWSPLFEEPRDIRIDPNAFRFEPQGSRIVVCVMPRIERFGAIHIPDEDIRHEPAGLGVIMSVGPTAFQDPSLSRHPYTAHAKFPESMLYRQVMFGAHTGRPMRLNYLRDTNWSGKLMIMTDLDILCVDFPESQAPYEPEGISMVPTPTSLFEKEQQQ